MNRKLCISTLIALLVFFILFSVVMLYVLEKDSDISKDEGNSEEMEDEETGEEAVEEAMEETAEEIGDKDGIGTKDEILFLLMGVDDLEGLGGVKAIKKMEENEKGYKKTNMRSDTMILCKFSYETGEITMLSIPRDSRVNIRGRKSKEKINHAHSYGGPNLAVQTVKDFLNVDLEYYVTVDYEAVREIVNAIGGVELDISKKIYYSESASNQPLFIDIQPDLKILDGDEVLKFLRFRSYPEGDIGRVRVQQYFLKEFIKQVLQPKNITKIPKMISTYFSYVDTNIPITSVLKVIPKLDDIDFENMETAIIPGKAQYIEHISYYIPNEEQTRELVEDMFESFILH